MMKFPLKGRAWSKEKKLSLYVIIPGWLYGFVWSSLPLCGWSSYTTVQGIGKFSEYTRNNSKYTLVAQAKAQMPLKQI